MNRVHGQQQAEHFGSAMSKPTQAALNRAGERARLGTGNLFSPVRLDTPLMRIQSGMPMRQGYTTNTARYYTILRSRDREARDMI